MSVVNPDVERYRQRYTLHLCNFWHFDLEMQDVCGSTSQDDSCLWYSSLDLSCDIAYTRWIDRWCPEGKHGRTAMMATEENVWIIHVTYWNHEHCPHCCIGCACYKASDSWTSVMTLNILEKFFQASALNLLLWAVMTRGKFPMEPGNGSPGHRVSDFGRVGSGHGSVCQTRCLTRFWVLTCTFLVALLLQSNTISA